MIIWLKIESRVVIWIWQLLRTFRLVPESRWLMILIGIVKRGCLDVRVDGIVLGTTLVDVLWCLYV